MYEPPPVLNDVLSDIFFDHHIKPSKDWLNLPSEELTRKQFENFKQKCCRSNLSEKSKRERAITKGLLINKLLTLGNTCPHFKENEYMELIASTEKTIVEEVKSYPKKMSIYQVNTTISRNKLSWRQKNYLVHLAEIFGALLDLKKSLENGYYIPKEAQRKIGVTFNYRVINEWQRRHIQWQAAAQVFWLDKDMNAEKILKKLFCSEILELLGLGILRNVDKQPNLAEGQEVEFRSLEDLIRKVNPRGLKKGRPNKNSHTAEHPVFIPLIYDAARKQMNGQGLYIAINTIAKVLKIQKKSSQEIINHPLILQYKSVVALLGPIIDAWILSAGKN